MSETILITGAAGFIGSHLCQQLLQQGYVVHGLDNFHPFYDPAIKHQNLESLLSSSNFTFHQADIRNSEDVSKVFSKTRPQGVIHLAAMAGVRPSIQDPALYSAVNLTGTTHLLQAAVDHNINKFVFASSSSVYGNNTQLPFHEDHDTTHPISPYAATKRAGELLCHAFYHLHRIPTTCLRFFTVYGPRQRPDLAIHKFMNAIDRGETIPLFGDGSTSRDYTYVDDTVDGLCKAYQHCNALHTYNLGNHTPVSLIDLIGAIEKVVGKPAQIDYQPMQPGDVNHTLADISRAQTELGYQPKTQLLDGLALQWKAMLNSKL